MAEIINGVKVPFLPVGGVDGLKQKPSVPLPPERSFDAILQKELQEVRFSKHAQDRLNELNIRLDQKDLADLQHAIALA